MSFYTIHVNVLIKFIQAVENIIILCKRVCIGALVTYQVMGQRCGVWDNVKCYACYICNNIICLINTSPGHLMLLTCVLMVSMTLILISDIS